MALPVGVRGKALDAQFVFKVAVVAGAVHHARPRLNAKEGCLFVGGCPQAEVGQVVVADGEHGRGRFAAQGDAGRAGGVVDEGVIRKLRVVKGKGGLCRAQRGVKQAVLPAQLRDAGAVEGNYVVGKAVAVGQRQVEGGMAADGKEQLLVGPPMEKSSSWSAGLCTCQPTRRVSPRRV